MDTSVLITATLQQPEYQNPDTQTPALFPVPPEKVMPSAAKLNSWPIAATGRQAQHTLFANASGFRDRGPTLLPLARFSHGFGRIANEIKPYLPNLPRLWLPRRCHPNATTVGSPIRSRLLHNVTPLSPHFPSLSAPLGFPPLDVP